MAGNVTVEITEQRVPPEAVAQRRDQVIANLDGLGMIDASQGRPAEVDPRGVLVGYTLKVNGVALPVAVSAYEVVATDQGPAVTVTMQASSVKVTVGQPSAATPEGRAAGTWGAPRPDPREGIPGWKPLAEEVGTDG